MEQFYGASLARRIMDGSFLAIATILHRVPRDPRDKRKTDAAQQDDREFPLRDLPNGWIRFAL